MGSKTFSQNGSNKYGSYTAYVRVNYSEDYSPSTNKTTVTLTSVEFYVSNYFGASPCYGTISFAGQTVKTFSGGYTNTATGGSWNTVTNSSGGNVTITHSSTGTASMSIGVSNFYVSFNGANFNCSGSETATLITHTSTLTVNPNGGTWNGSTSPQSFAQAPTSTKTIANPTRTNYRFTGWSLSGGGSLSGTTYTYSTSNGTLTANWAPNSYTVTCEDRVGSKTGALLGSNTKTYIYNTTANGSDFGKNTAYNAYYTGYYYVSSTSATVTGNITIYRIFAVNTYTLSVIASSQGVTTNISRVSSPLGKGSTGQITNGTTLYYNDVLSVNYTLGGAYQLISATVNNIDISDNVPYSLTVNSNVVVNISVKLGAIVYIGNEAYQAFIGTLVNNNVIWQQYQAFIGNGSTYDQY